MESITYASLGITADDIDQKLDQVWHELSTPNSSLAKKAMAESMDLAQLKGRMRSEVITVHTEGAGLDPATTAIVVAFAPTVAKILRDLWCRILLPRILHDFGEDTLKEEPRQEKKG